MTIIAPHLEMAAVLAFINDALGAMQTPRAAYTRDTAPEAGGDYVVVSLTRTSGGERRDTQVPRGIRYLSVVSVGTSAQNAEAMRFVVTRALEDSMLPLGDGFSTNCTVVAQNPVQQDQDDPDLWSAPATFKFRY